MPNRENSYVDSAIENDSYTFGLAIEAREFEDYDDLDSNEEHTFSEIPTSLKLMLDNELLAKTHNKDILKTIQSDSDVRSSLNVN